jgi:hypothetical protein
MTNDRSARFPMPRATLFEVPHQAGGRVASGGGSLWVTLDNDPRDIVLATGESFQLPPGRRALVYALDDAVLVLQQRAGLVARPVPARRHAWLRGLSLRPA